MSGRDQSLPLDEIRAWDSTAPGLLGPDPWSAHTFDDYLVDGGYATMSTPRSPREILTLIEKSSQLASLRGRGGAAFPTLAKIKAVATAARELDTRAVVVANGAEGEPLSFKDRYLLRHRPHQVLDGLLAVAAAVNADSAYVYVADATSRRSLSLAIDEIDAVRDPGGPRLLLEAAQDTYVAGEETAVVCAIDTGVARPKDKPPRPYQVGVGGAPTLVLNVETLAWIALALRPDTIPGPDRILATVSGAGLGSRLLELPTGLPVGELLHELTGDSNPPFNVLMGGFFGGIVPVSTQFDLSYDGLKTHGGGLGCGSLHFLEPTTCVLSIAADVVAYYAQNNARQCRTCMSSTDAIANFLAALGSPRADINLSETLTRWSTQLPGRGACAVPDGVALLLRTLLRHYPEVIADHQRSGCEACATAPPVGRWEHLSITRANPAPDRSPAVDSSPDLERAR